MDQKTSTNSIFIFIFGFLLAVFVSSLIFVSPLTGLLVLFVGIFLLIADKIQNKSIDGAVLLLSLLLISFGLGVLRYSIKDFYQPITPNLRGVVISEPEQRDNSTRFVLKTDNSQKVLINTDFYSALRYGDRVEVSGKLEEPGIIKDKNGGRPFDYGKYLSKDDIYHTMSFAKVVIVSSGHGSFIRAALIRVKNSYVSKIRDILPESEANLLAGFTILGKASLSRETIDTFRRAGVVHIVVLSGYHVALIIMFLLWFFKSIFLRVNLGLRSTHIMTILSLLAFVLMAGVSASILRATIMALVALGGKFIRRPYNARRALLSAAFILILFNPKILVFDVSFQLSFLATLGIIYLSPIVDTYFAKLISAKWGLRNLLAITVAAQVAVSPLLLYQMGNVSIVSLVSNILILPVVPFAMIIGFFATVLAFFSVIMALPLTYVAYLLLAWILSISSILGDLPFALFSISLVPIWAIALMYLAIIIFVARWRNYLPQFASSN